MYYMGRSRLVLLPLLIIVSLIQNVLAVNLNVSDKLTKEDLLVLDRDVTSYYDDDYISMSKRNVTFDQELFRSIRSIRHTHVFHAYDYLYSSVETMNKSQGSRVNQELCLLQLGALVGLAGKFKTDMNQVPIDVINFFESSGKVESGALNGNFIWRGAVSSCLRARIHQDHWSNRLNYNQRQQYNQIRSKLNHRDGTIQKRRLDEDKQEDIVGRYCIGHLKSKNWPKRDKYFEERLSIKLGVCLPETCHSLAFHDSTEARKMVDYLARYNLVAPFNGDSYELTSLYCFPDEDSPFRQWDTNTKVFVSFVIVWFLILIYTNIKYQQRMQAIQKLRNSVDIKMIINQRKSSLEYNDSGDPLDGDVEDGETESDGETRAALFRDKLPTISHTEPADDKVKKSTTTSLADAPSAQANLLPPNDASRSATPVPSDVEENDGEFNVIRPIVCAKLMKQKSKQTAPTTAPASQSGSSDSLDFVKAFSIESNMSYLLHSRTKESQRKELSLMQQQVAVNHNAIKRLSQQQLSSVNRRTSSSNEQLIKDLQDNNKGKVAIVSNGGPSDTAGAGRSRRETSQRRVNVDIFDGIKAIATSYIVFGHTLMIFFGLVTDLRFSNERMFDFTTIAVINSLQVVGLFYIITGTLISYISFSKQKPKQLLQPSFWLLVVIGRYIRLISPYLLVFWFAHNAATFTGSGAFWYDYRTDVEHTRAFCGNQDWSSVLFMSAADVKIPFDCVPQAWYLSNDFRTLLIIPFFIIILVKNTPAGYAAMFATIAYSLSKLNIYLNQANIDYGVLILWQPHVYSILVDRLHDVYTKLDVRISTYLMGIMVGHLLYMYDQRRIRDWPGWFRKWGLKVSLVSMIMLFFGAVILANPLVYQFLPAPETLDSSSLNLLIPLFKTLMEFSISSTLLLLATGGGYGWIINFLSCKFMKVMAQISYGVFLVHIEIMFKSPMYKFESDYWFLFSSSSFYIAQSYAVAFLLYILFEMPINNVLRQLFKRLFKLIVK